MAGKQRASCWLDWEEWKSVYELLYCFSDKSRQLEGLRLVDVWRSRTAAKLPLAVECTACLVAADIEETGPNCLSRTSRDLSIAMAVIRFVNGMVDQVQRGLYARSIQSIAEELNIPDWLVDIRHEATHASLPSMDTLQAGLGFALQWLRENYWEETLQSISREKNNIPGDVEKLLQEFVRNNLSAENAKERRQLLKPCQVSLLKQVTSSDKIRKLLLPVLMKDGILLPTDNQLEMLAKQSDKTIHLYMNFWLPLLNSLQEKFADFFPDLVNEITSRFQLESSSKTARKYVDVLILEILMKLSVDDHDFVSIDSLLHYCFSKPNQDTSKILAKILRFVPPSVSKHLKELHSIACPMSNILSRPINGDINHSYTDEEMKKYFQQFPIKGMDITAVETTISSKEDNSNLKSWRPVRGVNWGAIAAGAYLSDFSITPHAKDRGVLMPFQKEIDTAYEDAVARSYESESCDNDLSGNADYSDNCGYESSRKNEKDSVDEMMDVSFSGKVIEELTDNIVIF